MIKEKVTQEDLILYEILKNPVLCGEFIYNFNRTQYDNEFEFTDYQKEMLCDFNQYVSICTARATGKSVVLTSLILWILVYNLFPKDYVLYTVPNKVHLQPVWENLTRLLRSNTFLKNLISPSTGINGSDFTIKLLNSAVLVCRIAGQSGDGRNLIGLHTPFIMVDEGGYYPWTAFQEMQPVLNVWTEGCREMVAGVPTGLRENNVLYHCDMDNSTYTKHRVSSFDNPRLTDEDYQRAIEQYGKDTDDYTHYFLGEHGAPIFAVFDRRLFDISSYPVYKLTINGIELSNKIDEYHNKLAAFPSPPKDRKVIIGIDLGYTDPTAIVILYEDLNGRLKFHGRIQLNKVSYSIQDKFIDMIDTRMRPSIIGMDEGSTGKAVRQRLQEATEFLHKNYKQKLVPVDFSSYVSLGFNSDGEEIKSKAKPFSVSVLQEFCNSHKLLFSSTDSEMIAELERMTYSKNPSGDISYRTLTVRGGKRGEDHFTSALLCAMLAYYLENEVKSVKKEIKLFSARWL